MPFLFGESPANKWCFLADGASIGFIKSSKCVMRNVPIGIFGAPPNALCPGVKPPNRPTVNLSESLQSRGPSPPNNKKFYPRPYDQWSFGNVRADSLFRLNLDDVQELRFGEVYYEMRSNLGIFPRGGARICTRKDNSGRPNPANQFEIVPTRTISSACSSSSFPPINGRRETWKCAMNAEECGEIPIVNKIHLD